MERKIIENITDGKERAFYSSFDVDFKNISIDGPEDGESAFKESGNFSIENSTFNLRYPFWHDNNIEVKLCNFNETCRAAFWYTKNAKLHKCVMKGVKAFRECSDLDISFCNIDSEEPFWRTPNINVHNSEIKGFYAFFQCNNIRMDDCKFTGKYSFQYTKDVEIEDLLAVEEIFKDTPNAVIFTGDTHFPGINERAINQVNFTTINLGSSSYSRMVNASATECNDFYNVQGTGSKIDDKMSGNAKFKEAYTPTIQVVDVKSDASYTIDRYFTDEDERKVGETWSINPIKTKSDFTYTNARFENKEAAKELYGKEGLSWDSEDKVTFGVNLEQRQMTVHFKDVKEHHFVEHYKITVNGSKVYDVVSNYYKYPVERENKYERLLYLIDSDEYQRIMIFTNTKEMAKQCLEQNVAYVPGDGFFPDEGHNNCIRLNYSKLNEEEIEKGMTILGQIIKANLK